MREISEEASGMVTRYPQKEVLTSLSTFTETNTQSAQNTKSGTQVYNGYTVYTENLKQFYSTIE
jgi:hypothetical protein